MEKNPDDEIKTKKTSLFSGVSMAWPAIMSGAVYIETPALKASGALGMMGAAAIGFTTTIFMIAGGFGGLMLGSMAALTIEGTLRKQNKQISPSKKAIPILAGGFWGLCAGLVAADKVGDDVVNMLPSQPETQAPKTEQTSKSKIQNLPVLSDAAHKAFTRDQVLMQSRAHALVLPAGYNPRMAA